ASISGTGKTEISDDCGFGRAEVGKVLILRNKLGGEHRMGSVYKRKWKDKHGHIHESDVFWIKYYKDGKPIRESSESTKESDANKLLKAREGDVVKGVPITPRFSRIKIDELFDDLVTEYQVNGRDTINDLKARLRLHLRPYFGGQRAAAITTAEIRNFIS